jgi:hypothetical protein
MYCFPTTHNGKGLREKRGREVAILPMLADRGGMKELCNIYLIADTFISYPGYADISCAFCGLSYGTNPSKLIGNNALINMFL